MSHETLLPKPKSRRPVDFRLCDVSGHTTELLEIVSDDPAFHVLFITGNPGVITFYTDFLESLYEFLGGNASVTAIAHISHTQKNWEKGRLFSFQEQIDHKVDFIRQELQTVEVPIVLVGHSIGSYMSLEILRRCTGKVNYFVGLYPFLMLNQLSGKQSLIGNIAESTILSTILSCVVASLGLLPKIASKFIVSKTIGKSWSDIAIEAVCTRLLKYHTIRNVLFMAMMEFRKLAETPDWELMRKNKDKIAFLFGDDDHWAPLHMFDEISKRVPDIPLSIEREGHTHTFCSTQAGSIWVAKHVASLLKNQMSSRNYHG